MKTPELPTKIYFTILDMGVGMYILHHLMTTEGQNTSARML